MSAERVGEERPIDYRVTRIPFSWDRYGALLPCSFYYFLQEGAWREGFEEWAEYTDLDEETVGVVDDLNRFQAFEFYRDPTDDHLRFDAPTVPEDWRERDVTESLDSSSVSAIDGELHDLGRAVHETLQNYLHGPATPPTGVRSPLASAKSRAR